MSNVSVTNEIGRLRRVLVHRPGPETRRFPHGEFALAFPLRPANSDFNLAQAQAEHDALTAVVAQAGVEVVEVTDLLGETLRLAPEAKGPLIARYLANCRIEGDELVEAAARYLDAAEGEAFIERLFNGMRYGDTDLARAGRFPFANLTGSAFDPDTFLAGPLNTAFFTRDPVSIIGGGISLNHMYWHDRNREIDLLQAIADHHPAFAGATRWFDHGSSFHLEGGDVVNLSEHAVALGLSSRTESLAIDRLAQRLLWVTGEEGAPDDVSGAPAAAAGKEGAPAVDAVYVVEVPQTGNRLHLDAYLSRIDYDVFAVDPELTRTGRIWRLGRGWERGSLRIDSCEDGLAPVLAEALGLTAVRLMDFGDDGTSRMDFEYGNGAAGILPLAPGNLCVCAENTAANERLDAAGMTLHPVSIQEMTAGFGGPNSLCLPLVRESL